MNKTILIFSLLLSGFIICNAQFSKPVNPFIGTGGHGHTYPGATAPFGMVQLSPDTRLTGWDGCSGYHYSDTIVYGFSHTHLSGTGVSDYGDILVLPVQGNIKKYRKNKPGSLFKHSNEKADAGYYHTYLDDYGVNIDLTATERCGFHKYTFDKKANTKIFVDLKHRDHVKESGLKIVNDHEIEGYRYSTAWAQNQKIFFVMRFSKDFDTYEIFVNGEKSDKSNFEKTDSIKAFFDFILDDSKQILVKVGVSAVDFDGARKNLDKEIPDWDFDTTLSKTQAKWQTQLDKIQISSNDNDKKTIFYSALYHTMIVPNIFSDVDGRYRGMDDKIHTDKMHNIYTVFSLWDTYRATHPLYTLIEQKRTTDFINTFIHHWEQSGKLPVWELAGNETNCMIGIHSIPVISDAILKNIEGFDLKKAYNAMISSMAQDKPELNYYRKYGYIPADKMKESVSKTLEYAFDDWSIARVAEYIGDRAGYRKYITRAQFYKNIFDPQGGFMRARINGGFRNPFDPREVDFNFTEANSWQYSFYVPQDIEGMISLYEGKRLFSVKLDSMFNTSSKTTGRYQADITGLIGQYAHGNEPSHHIAYLYDFAGQPWKTQKTVRKIMKEMYRNATDGLSGNEDCGQMSAWYIFSALGFYPLTPGSNEYIIGSPIFDKAVINLENENKFNIITKNNSDKNIYIKTVKLNGKPYNKFYISHIDIMNGGTLEFEMDSLPNITWATGKNSVPFPEIKECKLLPVPYITDASKTFLDKKNVEIKHLYKNVDIYYKLNNTGEFKKYNSPFMITNNAEIAFYAMDENGNKSYIETAKFYKIKKGRTVSIKYPYSSQYTGGGDDGLIDMIRGGENFADGSWQGYRGIDFEAVIDLGKTQDLQTVSAGFLQSAGSWIWMPEYVEFYYSIDGKNYKKIGKVMNDIDEKEANTVIKNFTLKTNDIKTRYIKVYAKNRGFCPKWHPGAG
ncbi:MAG TPA: glycoside hydrolase family 92 protein, partial [Bacteroidetes bacterium]|nr:glycoside hydrolase family 92 protein [Bacteroidota bacterium]